MHMHTPNPCNVITRICVPDFDFTLCSLKVLTRVKGPSARLGPNVPKSVLLRVDAARTNFNAGVTAAVGLAAWRKVSPF